MCAFHWNKSKSGHSNMHNGSKIGIRQITHKKVQMFISMPHPVAVQEARYQLFEIER